MLCGTLPVSAGADCVLIISYVELAGAGTVALGSVAVLRDTGRIWPPVSVLVTCRPARYWWINIYRLIGK